MKKNLHLLFIASFILSSFFSAAQITKLANNSNIQTGMTIGTKTILVDKKDSLWITDGTAAGTKKYTKKVALDSSLTVAYYKGKLYFAGVDAAHGSELWVTDGTNAGTLLIKDILAGTGGSVPVNFFVFNNILYFFAKTTAAGKELWKSDGTAAGTVIVKDINPGAASSYTTSSLFYTNNSILYFIASDATHGAELWKTNGTAAGTVLIKDINPGTASSTASGFTALNATTVIFSANGGTTGQELWKTNGTAAGTVLVKDLLTGIPGYGSMPSQFFAFNNKVYFTTALDLTYGSELWVTNGTAAGTTLVKDINPGQNSSIPFLSLAIIIGNKFYFQATTAANGSELWGSDGTAAATTLVKDIRTGTAGSNPFIWLNFFGGSTSGGLHKTLFNGKIFLQATDATHGTELWITNGTAAGTTLVKDIRAGTASSLGSNSFSYFYTTADLYFSANNGTTGEELWKSNGTAAGTLIVKDIYAGAGNSSPAFLFVLVNKQLLFTANDGDNTTGQTDLFKLNATVDTITLDQSHATAKTIAPDGRVFYIYPNPVKDKLSIVVNNTSEKKAAIAITDQNGKQLYRQELNNVIGSYQYSFDVHSYASGMYYLQLITDKGIATKQFIKN